MSAVLIQWLIFIHVLSVVTFFLAHGTSVAMAFKIRSETKFDRIRAMLDLSQATISAVFFSYLAMGLTGLALPFFVHVWNKGWVWLSIVLMLFVAVYMGMFNEKGYKIVRKLVGLPYMQGSKTFPAESPAAEAEVVAYIKKINVHALAFVGYVIPVIVLWLMIFKPF